MTSDEARILTSFRGTTPFIEVRFRKLDLSDYSYNVIEKYFGFSEQKEVCLKIENFDSYLDNLCRMRLIEIPFDSSLADKTEYERLKIIAYEKYNNNIPIGKRVDYTDKMLLITSFGKDFLAVCIRN